jgi:hypothetical protein
MMDQCLKPAPKTGASSRDLLDQPINQTAHDQQGQAHVHKYPEHTHQREAGFFEPATHHGLGLAAKAKFVQHGGEILGA